MPQQAIKDGGQHSEAPVKTCSGEEELRKKRREAAEDQKKKKKKSTPRLGQTAAWTHNRTRRLRVFADEPRAARIVRRPHVIRRGGSAAFSKQKGSRLFIVLNNLLAERFISTPAASSPLVLYVLLSQTAGFSKIYSPLSKIDTQHLPPVSE